jgi:hypothetical protein
MVIIYYKDRLRHNKIAYFYYADDLSHQSGGGGRGVLPVGIKLSSSAVVSG